MLFWSSNCTTHQRPKPWDKDFHQGTEMPTGFQEQNCSRAGPKAIT